jgi:NADH-quinone oxidoreductase subunit L
VWITPIVSSLFVSVIGRFSGKARNYFAVMVSLVTTVFALSMIPDIYFGTLSNPESSLNWIPSLGISAGVRVDPLSVFFACLIAFFSFVIILYSLGYMEGEEGLSRYYFFMLLFIGSMIGLVMSDNFLQMFIFWEIVGLCSYSLVSFWYKRPGAVRAGFKVFLITRIGDACLLAAIALLYASLGSFSFSYTIDNIGRVPLPTLTAVAFLMLGGAIAKSAQLPLHTWLYSAMEAPTSVSALLHGATMVKAGVYLIARLFTLLAPLGSLVSVMPSWLTSLAWIGAITAFIGATLALYTPDIKGVPAYSTISQIGFMMAALGAASSSSSQGWFAGLFHLTSHAFFQGLGFLAIGGIVHTLGTRDMRQMGGLRKMMPVTFGLCLVVLFARTGVPPFASFFSKGLIISSLWSTGDLLLVLTIYAATAVTFAYTLRFIILTFLRQPSEYVKQSHVHEPSKIMLFASGILAALCFVWGFLANSIAKFMQVNVEIGIGEVFSPSTLIFLLVLLMGGLPVYFTYYRKSKLMETVKRSLAPLNTVLEHGYFFDDFYEKVVVGGVMKVSKGLGYIEDTIFARLPYVVGGVMKVSKGLGYIEDTIFARLPYVVANGVTSLARSTQRYFDVLIDRMLYIAANKTLVHSSKIGKTHDESLQRYIVAALLGFLILLIIVILTMLK